MAKKGGKPTPAEQQAGQKNLQAWVADNPSHGHFKHGAHSEIVRRRYGDKRFREGKQLAAIMKGLKQDFGWDGNIPTMAQLLLDSIKSKVVVILQIGKYVDKQTSIIDEKTGELLPCLGRNFTVYTESLRRDLEALISIGSKKPSRIPTIEELIAKAGKEEAK